MTAKHPYSISRRSPISDKLTTVGGTGGFVFIYQLEEGAGRNAIFQTNLPAEIVYTMLDDICEQMENQAASGGIIGDEGGPPRGRKQ